MVSLFVFSGVASAQTQLEEEQTVTCKIKANNKEYQSQANEDGYFKKVYGIQPSALVPIEVTYTSGKPGEKVILAAVHGGSFDNQKQLKVVQLDNLNKCTFTFQLTDQPGLFEIALRKGSKTKVVQLWAGNE